MKRTATIVLAALGIHCTVDAEPPAEHVVAASQLRPLHSSIMFSSTLRHRPVASEMERAMVVPELTARSALADVSRAVGDDGATYVAGVFTGVLVSDDITLESRGADDVYLARIDSDGRVAWARAIGSKKAESDPRVTFDEGRVKLVGFTEGQVDCGGGPLGRTWSSAMFFFCVFDTKGAPMSGGTFPTGNP